MPTPPSRDASGPAGKTSRAAASRQEILNEAATLMLEKGYSETSLRELAGRVGMKAGSLYYHFASKEQLALEVLQIGVDRVKEAVQSRVESLGETASPQERFETALNAHLDTLLSESVFTSAHIRCLPTTPLTVQAEIRKARRSYEEIWTGLIQDLHEKPLSSEQGRHLRMIILGALNWSLTWYDASHDDKQAFALTLKNLIISSQKA